ncbi:MAG: PE family protein [Mycolicibacter algericus]|uniref:PE domain-containing protein n=1 Tax=Mycolicibacter longobardus TaxID=1108812 RepID=A0A1X1Y639_9MYCO|nr:PE family protein [Mycolicibacter longobardus]ORW06592.1 hypothetical protein AWC16_01260 [Mycolicibacter longobardus]
MSFLVTHPDLLAAATGDLAAVGSATTVIVAAAYQVRALSAAQFVAHVQIYHAVSGQAAAIHEQFTATLAARTGSYAAAETANAAAAT